MVLELMANSWPFAVNSKDYQQILNHHLTPVVGLLGGPDFVFQDDRALTHIPHWTKCMISSKVMYWHVLSSDLNPMENEWGKLAQKVCENGCQCFLIKELKTVI